MKYNGVIAKKIETIQEALRKLGQIGEVSVSRLKEDYFLKRGVERTLKLGRSPIRNH